MTYDARVATDSVSLFLLPCSALLPVHAVLKSNNVALFVFILGRICCIQLNLNVANVMLLSFYAARM